MHFAFLSPAYLFGSFLALIPLVIHLIHKSRVITIRFSSLRFIREAVRENSSRFRLKEILLLLLRMAVIVLLSFAAAKPVLKTGKNFPVTGQEKGKTLVLIVDNSLSMGYFDNALSSFEEAVKKARTLVTSLYERGDGIVIIPAADTRDLLYNELYSREAALRRLDNLRLSYKPAALVDAVKIVRSSSDRSSGRNRLIYVFSDFQRSNFSNIINPPSASATADRLVLVDAGHGDFFNTAVTAVTPPGIFYNSGADVMFSLTVANFGPLPGDVTAAAAINGKKASQQSFHFRGAESTVSEFTWKAGPDDMHFGSVTIDGDNLKLDNTYYFLDSSSGKKRILIVDDTGDSGYLQKVFDSSEMSGSLSTTVCKSPELSGKLSTADLVIMVSFSDLTPDDASALRSFLDRKGSILLCMENDLDADLFNQTLFMKKVSPVRVQNKNLVPRDQTNAALSIREADFTHGYLSFFRDYNFFPLIKTWGYFKVDFNPSDPSVSVLARYNNKSPALIEYTSRDEKERETGHVLLFTSSFSGSMNDIILHPNFPPFVFQAVKYLTIRKFKSFDAGIQYSAALNLLETDEKTRIQKYDARTGSFGAFGGEDFDEPGIYKAGSEYFTVEPPLSESDLTRADDRTLQAVFGPHASISGSEDFQKKSDELNSGSPLSGLFIICSLLALLLEMFLANNILSRISLTPKTANN